MAKSSNRTKQLVIDAMLAAMCAVLGYVAIESNAIKLTFETLPILVAALMFGPVDGLIVGGIGTMIYQLLRYGFGPTTVLWMIPYIVEGLLVGYVAKKKNFKLTKTQGVVLVVIAELLITALNTGVIYADSQIYGYYYPALIFGSLAIRIVIAVIKGGVYGAIIPVFIDRVKSALK